jgi:hypothetical protein
VARDTVGLDRALVIDRANVSRESGGGMTARQNGIGSTPEDFFPRVVPFNCVVLNVSGLYKKAWKWKRLNSHKTQIK